MKQAALTHLDIHLRALSKGATLSDASAYNIQFDGNRPIFIDHLSLRPYREGQFWQGHRQFCYQFLNPLLLRAKVGVPHNAFYRGSPEGLPSANLNRMLPWRARLDPRVFSHVTLLARFEKTAAKLGNAGVAQAVKGRRLPKQAFERMLKSSRDLIEGLNPHDKGRTAWSDYADANSYSTDEARKKHAFVSEFAQKTEPAMLWDIGCNTGDYSYTALKAGAHLVIGFENDPSALERAFHRSRSDHLRFLPLYLDAADPSPAQGWNQQERMGLAQRRSASAIFALAVIHHICIGRNVPLPEALSWLVGLAPQGVIEFVPKRDSMVQELLRLRDDVFPDYNEPVFDATMAKLARMVRSEVITDNGRRLVWYDRS